MSRVEKRRSNGSLPVAISGAFAPPPQSGLTPQKLVLFKPLELR